ncbi:hypothetical protein LCGC14_2851130, partial [marine sediment metagenome]
MQILKVLVGSHAHGLATPESDRDYRGVFVTPTSDLLRIGVGKPKGHHWAEGGTEDDTALVITVTGDGDGVRWHVGDDGPALSIGWKDAQAQLRTYALERGDPDFRE